MADNKVKIRIKDEPTKTDGRFPINPLMVEPPMTKEEKKLFIDSWIAAIPVKQPIVHHTTDIIIIGTP